jgi:hypothetical protein
VHQVEDWAEVRRTTSWATPMEVRICGEHLTPSIHGHLIPPHQIDGHLMLAPVEMESDSNRGSRSVDGPRDRAGGRIVLRRESRRRAVAPNGALV